MKTPLCSLLFVTLSMGAWAGDECVEGCTPGYWKTHPESWNGVGHDFTTNVHHFDLFNATFGVTEAQSGFPDSATLLHVAGTGSGGVIALGRHAAAGLASADALSCYAHTVPEVIAIYRDGVDADPGPLTIETAKTLLESANEQDCPLGNVDCKTVCLFCFGDGSGTECPCDNASPAGEGGCVNSTGQAGKLDNGGFPSVSADSVVFSTSQLPANAFAVYVQSEDVSNGGAGRFFGDGLRCVRGDVRRIAVKQSVNGASTFPEAGDDLVSVAGMVPPGGGQRFYQVFYRDMTDYCTSANFNLTNGVSVYWTP